jgi:hypothetical protein
MGFDFSRSGFGKRLERLGFRSSLAPQDFGFGPTPRTPTSRTEGVKPKPEARKPKPDPEALLILKTSP